ncbi:MAG: Hsp33 family molecular chaperone HslO [Rhodospirillaceae bacterium]|nr:Hsp33 family molecular chaperone HslO [Rhodospirillaceae bacterium]
MTKSPIDQQSGVSQPFLLYDGAVRGRIVRLNGVADTVLRGHHDYPDDVTKILGESMAAAAALADGLKFEGSFTLQIQGDGPVHMLVTDITSDRVMRGCAKFHEDELATLKSGRDTAVSLLDVLGTGHIAFTVDQGADMERYQGIIELAGTSIGDCVHQYFQQSEQLETAIKIVSGRTDPNVSDSPWQAAALMVQRMPVEGGCAPTDEDEDAWRAAVILMSSVSNEELLNPSLTEEDVLSRLYGTVGGRLLDRRDLTAGCRCSRARSAKILASFPMDEILSMAENGKVSMTCEFCESNFQFTENELSAVKESSSGEFDSVQGISQ